MTLRVQMNTVNFLLRMLRRDTVPAVAFAGGGAE
jgi:hypothetical protein